MPKYNYDEYVKSLKEAAEKSQEERSRAFYENIIKDQEQTATIIYDDLIKAANKSQEERTAQMQKESEELAEKAKQAYLKKAVQKGLYDNNSEYSKALLEMVKASSESLDNNEQ